ncbi:helix-turn-helix domain-containing protein [Pedobacter cryoconitis]|uniref:helix-turn-helix domain-containing protein n=1 Tax=Pedobacter cryoconitis TaxID=188932 RepID=UPI00161581BE|nr:helix-turn-helix domain-containing protein [Pedobacter cryoconitis]MBB5647908.1 DNA-binding XRE family transcriptional regulator [Pedobacter cryoconitis]
MLDIGSKIMELRKRKAWLQGDLAKAVEASRDIIGKYKRNENSPSVEMALKQARVFDISVDYLLGEGKHAAYDKDTLKRLEDIQVLDQDTRLILFNIIDTFLRNAKARKAYGQ